jgi:ferredoxin
MRFVAGRDALPKLILNLRSLGYAVVGPKLADGTIRLTEITRFEDMAAGVVDVQAPGKYRLEGSSSFVFSGVNGPDSAKKFLHPACVQLVRLEDERGPRVQRAFHADKKYAFFGLRPCDLKAVEVLDRVMMMPQYEDPVYVPLRRNSIVIVVNCGRAGENCFCASMGTGPKAKGGYDVAVTELPGRVVVDVVDGRMDLMEGVQMKPATEEDLREEQALVDKVTGDLQKRIDRENPSDFIYEGVESPVWKDVAERCLGCGNCTMVCPTCFCNIITDVTDMRDGSVTRERVWDSCLSKNFTYSAGGNPRLERKARYRQFVMHKFAYWPDQFGLYGCVGCGRCITWCPVGIDISETVNEILRSQGDKRPLPEVVKVA